MIMTDTPAPLNDEQRPSSPDVPSFMPENDAEVARQLLVHRYLSEQMGGILPHSLNLSQVQQVLDVACGAGGWVYDIAWQHPSMQVTGVDDRAYFVEQAQRLIASLDNARIVLRDLHHLEGEPLTPGLFDLVHMRLLATDLPPQAFPALLQSLLRLCHVHSLLVWTELELPITTSPALQQLLELTLGALKTVGRSYTPGHTLGITAHMEYWLRQAGYHITYNGAVAIDVSQGTQVHDVFVRQIGIFTHQVRDFLLKTGVTSTSIFEETFSHMRQELQAETFRGLIYARTVVGEK